MAIKLKKDDSAQLTLQKFSVGLGWKVNQISDEDFDLDVSAFMVTSSGKIPSDDYLVFYNSEKRLRRMNSLYSITIKNHLMVR